MAARSENTTTERPGRRRSSGTRSNMLAEAVSSVSGSTVQSRQIQFTPAQTTANTARFVRKAIIPVPEPVMPPIPRVKRATKTKTAKARPMM